MPEPTEVIPEGAPVVLTWPILGNDAKVLMPGTRGTIVHSYPTGYAYEVAFTKPYRTVITVLHYEIRRIDDRRLSRKKSGGATT